MSERDIHERTQEALSAAHDEPRSVHGSDMKKAREHLRRCPQCRAFEAALADRPEADGGTLPGELAPDGLVSRILAAVEAERSGASAGPVAEGAATQRPPAPEDAPRYVAQPEDRDAAGIAGERGRRHVRPWTRSRRWGLGLAAAAAVIALFVGARLLVGPYGLGSLSGSRTAGVTGGAAAPEAADSGRLAATQSAPGAALSGAQQASPQAAPGGTAGKRGFSATSAPVPGYAPSPAVAIPALGPEQASGYVPPATPVADRPVLLSFGTTDVWRFDGWLRNTPSTSLVRVGRVRARLGAPVPRARAVYEAAGDRSARYVGWAADDYQVYRPVRMLAGGRTYVLTTAEPIGDWGRWPVWPSAAIPYPSAKGYPFAWTAIMGSPAKIVGGIRASRGVAIPAKAEVGSPAVKLPLWSWWRARGPR